MNGYVDEELQPREGLVDRERVKELVRARVGRRRVQKRRVLLVAAALTVCLGLVGWSCAEVYGERIFQLVGGGQITIGDSGEEHYVEAHPSDGYDENGKPLVVSLEENRLWVVARGQRVDVTDQVDEKTPYVDTWWDGEGNLYYVIVGGTPEDYGWYEGVTVRKGKRHTEQLYRHFAGGAEQRGVVYSGPGAGPGAVVYPVAGKSEINHGQGRRENFPLPFLPYGAN